MRDINYMQNYMMFDENIGINQRLVQGFFKVEILGVTHLKKWSFYFKTNIVILTWKHKLALTPEG